MNLNSHHQIFINIIINNHKFAYFSFGIPVLLLQSKDHFYFDIYFLVIFVFLELTIDFLELPYDYILIMI